MRRLPLLFLAVALVAPPSGATRQVLVHRTQGTFATTPIYLSIGGGHDASIVSTDLVDCPIPIPGNFVELDFGVFAAPGAGKSATSTLYKDGAATSLTATISDADDGPIVTRTPVSIAAGNTVRLQGTTSGGASVRPMSRLVFDSIQHGWSFLCAQSNDQAVSSSPEYMALTGTTSPVGVPICSTQTDCMTSIPVAGIAKYLYCIADVEPGPSGSSYTITVTDGVSDTAITCTMNGSTNDADCEDIANSATLVGEDWITLKIDLTDGGSGINLPKIACGLGFRADEGDVFLIPYSSHGAGTFGSLSSSANRFSRVNAASGYEGPLATERTEQSTGHALAVKAMTVHLKDAPGAGTSYQMTLQEDGSDTSATVSISGASESFDSWTGNAEIAEYDLLRTKWVPTTSPTVTRGACTYAAVSRPRRPIVMEAEEIGVEHGP